MYICMYVCMYVCIGRQNQLINMQILQVVQAEVISKYLILQIVL